MNLTLIDIVQYPKRVQTTLLVDCYDLFMYHTPKQNTVSEDGIKESIIEEDANVLLVEFSVLLESLFSLCKTITVSEIGIGQSKM